MTLRSFLQALCEGAVFWTLMAVIFLLFYALLPEVMEGWADG